MRNDEDFAGSVPGTRTLAPLPRCLAERGWRSGGIATLNHRLPSGKPPASSNHRPRRQGSAPVLRSSPVHPPQWLCYGGWRGRATEGGLHPILNPGQGSTLHPTKKPRNIQNRLFGFERKCFKVNAIGKREERKQTGYPRISSADGRTPLPVARGVKALPMHREPSPRPGGIRGGLEHGDHLWELRQRVCEVDWVGVRMRKMPGSGAISFHKILEVRC